MTSLLEKVQPTSVAHASRRDADKAVRDALRRAGMSAPELLAEGRAGRFSSLRARMAWVAVGGVLEAQERSGKQRARR